MITIKKHHKNQFNDLKFIKQFSSVVKFAYNRRKDSNDTLTISNIEKIVKEKMLNIDLLDASLIKNAVKKGFELSLDNNNKLYFGGKRNCFQSKYKKSNNYINKRLIPIDLRGSSSDSNGNRKAKLDIENNCIIFKHNKTKHYNIYLNFSKKEKDNLFKLQKQCELNKNYFNLKIDSEHLWISYDEKRLVKDEIIERNFIKDRILSFDLNPNYIGLTICDYKENEEHKIVYKEILSLQRLNECLVNKKRYEYVMINKHILKLVKSFHVESVSFENLNIRSKDNKKGKKYNRLVNNLWNRNYIINNFVKVLNLNKIVYRMIRPEYSSFIGQMKYAKDYDMIGASVELGYRSYLIGRGLNEYSSIDSEIKVDCLPTQWKKMVNGCLNYRDLYKKFKENKMLNSYRFVFDCYGQSFLRLYSYGSEVDLIIL